MTPLIVDGRAPFVLPAYPLPGRDRGAAPLYVIERTLYIRGPHGWERVPRGYVTDFASIPTFATMLTFMNLQPLSDYAWAAIAHDWWYAIGQPGYRAWADDTFHDRMVQDRVNPVRREILFRAVRLGGQSGYDEAPKYWDTEDFADPDTGQYPVKPPFAREEAFVGARWGLRPDPDWIEPMT